MTTKALSETELCAQLRLHLTPGLGPKRWQRLLAAFGDAQSACQASDRDWQALGLPKSCLEARHHPDIAAQVTASLHWLGGEQRHLLQLGQPDYPALLAEIPDAPPLLYVEGEAALLERPQIAVVGSRQASPTGLDNARCFARTLASAGFVVTSGLALGIDGAAHQSALEAQGQSIAVLGTGLCCLYPPRHRPLAAQLLAEGGALVSELPLNTPPQARNFPRRNRLISGLSLGVLVVEASPSSGSLITARLAAEQGREVFAIPGPIQHPGARGCHQLIREGALLVESVADILSALHSWQRTTQPDLFSHLAQQAPIQADEHPLLRHLRASPLSTEALALISGQPVPELLASLTDLELEGRILCEAGLWTCLQR